MALASTTVSAAIAALSITGMKSIRDVTNVPDELDTRSLPCMFPDPENWLDAGEGTIEDETTFGTPSTRFWVVHRAYNYVWLYKEAGDGRGLKSHYSGGSTMLDAIVTAIVALDVSGVDVQSVSHTRFGLISDPSGKNFYGSFITIRCRERINA
ncbi:MAG: hypothetical protein KKD77_23885 [Gammaproteobacteria bacterium]|nr:hypothetical protein [Gammaproteobacteria bacterium]